MDMLFEFLIEVVVEMLFMGGESAVKDSSVSKPVRYVIAILLLLVFVVVIGAMVFAGFYIMENHTVAGGIALFAATAILLISGILKIRKTRKELMKRDKKGEIDTIN